MPAVQGELPPPGPGRVGWVDVVVWAPVQTAVAAAAACCPALLASCPRPSPHHPSPYPALHLPSNPRMPSPQNARHAGTIYGQNADDFAANPPSGASNEEYAAVLADKQGWRTGEERRRRRPRLGGWHVCWSHGATRNTAVAKQPPHVPLGSSLGLGDAEKGVWGASLPGAARTVHPRSCLAPPRA
jgi:hypothetical protein